MSTAPAAGVLGPSVGNVSQSAFKTAIEQLLTVVKEIIGGAGFYGSTINMSSDAFSVVKDFALFNIDGEGSAADNLKNITAGSTTLRDGQIIGIRTTGVVITIKNGAGGTGQTYTRSGSDYYLRDTTEIAWFRYSSAGSGSWNQIFVDWYKYLVLLLGFVAAATLTATSNVVTPSSAHILIDSTGAETVNQIARTNFPVDGPFLLVGYSTAHAQNRTLKHNTGGSVAGKMYHNDSDDILLDASTKYVLYYATTISGLAAWQEITRFGFTTASGSWTTSSKNANFNIGASKTRYIVDTSSADITATFNTATSGNYTDEWEFVISGPYDLIIVPYQTTPEFVRDATNKATDSARIPSNTARLVRALAIVESAVNGVLLS